MSISCLKFSSLVDGHVSVSPNSLDVTWKHLVRRSRETFHLIKHASSCWWNSAGQIKIESRFNWLPWVVIVQHETRGNIAIIWIFRGGQNSTFGRFVHWRNAQDQLSQHCRRSHYFTIVFGPLEIAIYGILPFRHGQIAGISVSLPCWLSRLIPFGTSGADHAKHCSWCTIFNVFGQLFCSDDLVASGLQVKEF